MAGSDITISTADGEFGAYLAKPASGSGPGVVVIQEIFGVNAGIRQICDTLADQGFVALAPDLFWRIEPGIQITDKSEEEWQKAFELYQKFDVEKGMEDIQATITHLRGTEGVSAKVGTVGYCLGGLLAFLSATRTDADAEVGYYGVGIHEKLSEAGKIKTPLLLHIAEEDQFVDKDAQSQIKSGLNDNAHVTIYSYPGMDHAFARVDGTTTNEEAANLANGRTLDFFRENLS